jgi:hypothetical protein
MPTAAKGMADLTAAHIPAGIQVDPTVAENTMAEKNTGNLQLLIYTADRNRKRRSGTAPPLLRLMANSSLEFRGGARRSFLFTARLSQNSDAAPPDEPQESG